MMAARSSSQTLASRQPSAWFNWLKILDKRVKKLRGRSNWLEDPVLAPQRCRLFIMARFPKLPRPFPDVLLAREFLRGETQIADSKLAKRILGGLKPMQKSQVGGLLLDILEASQFHGRYQRSSKFVRNLAAESDRRTRMLARQTAAIRSKVEKLLAYASSLHATLGLEHVRAATLCLKALEKLEDDSTVGSYYRSRKADYQPLEDPRQLGIVELYWFFRHECRCSGRESEVRVAMIVNEFLSPSGRELKYISRYRDAESQGSSAVRLAVSRYRPLTTN